VHNERMERRRERERKRKREEVKRT